MERFTFSPLTWTSSEEYLYTKGLIGSRLVNLNIKLGTTHLLKSDESLTSEERFNIFEQYDVSKGGVSPLDNKVLVLRNPIIPNTQLDDDGTEIQWEESVEDPFGKITSLFQATNIKPYLPFDVLLLGSKSQEVKDYHIMPSNDKEKPNLRRLYWDLEMVTARKEFVYAKYIDNHIIAVSMVFTYNNTIRKIFLYWGTYDIKNKEFESYRFSNEANMIRRFYQLIEELAPDRMYTYNGDSFDIPYLIERSKLHSIKPNKINFERARIKGRFTWETVNRLNIPGVEQIDIIRVMLKMFTGLANYKLETVGKVFLGEGKTGLPIEQMFQSFWEQSPQGMEDLANYSIQDSILLSKLNDTINIDYLLENIANAAGMLVEDILDTYDSSIISKISYMVDPGSYFLSETEPSNYLSNIELNVIYKNIHIYDYTMLYTLEMSMSDNEYIYTLSEVSQDLPASLKADLYWSKYNPKNKETYLIKDLISYYSDAIEITNTNIKLLNPINETDESSTGINNIEVLKLIGRYTHFIQLGKVSFVAKDWLDNLVKVGTMKIIKPTFKLKHDYLNNILRYIFDDIEQKPEVDKVDKLPLEDLAIDIKIKDIGQYPKDSLKYILASQYGLKINTWVPVKYYMTKDGPILIDLYKGNEIDKNFYEKEVKKIRILLKYKI